MASNVKETWKQIPSLKGTTSRNYAVSNHGRLASFDKDINDKLMLKPHLNGGFPLISVNSNGKSKALFIHNAVAEVFLKKRNPKCVKVIHLDHNKANNEVSNLKWVTQVEQIEHNKKSPLVLEAITRKIHTGATAKKLDEKKVIRLKKELWDPKRKLTFKKLAEKYGIAEMNLYRIKSGEMWFHVHVEGEPMFTKYKEQLKNIEFHNKKEAKATAERVKKEAAEKKTADAKAKKDSGKKKKVVSKSLAPKAKKAKVSNADTKNKKPKSLKKLKEKAPKKNKKDKKHKKSKKK
ncbi:MAG: NUMOD4 domain-containing protein [Bacteroidota bacterium]